MFPIPRYLKDILKPTGNQNNEYELTGKIICACGSENFTIKLVGDTSFYESENVIKVVELEEHYFLIIKVKCNNCDKEHLIFDKDFHGWDGFVCGGNASNLPRPDAKIWYCNKCSNANHSMAVKIHSQGQDQFIEEAGEEFDKNDWTEAFDWITIKTECKSCNETNEEWISYETM